ncbi:MAG: hypothetical protein ACRD1Z_14120, partial [Vicinamibacteria bacterium]
VQAAELAAEGLTGARDILGDPQGFLRRFAKKPLDFVFSGYGSAWVTESLTFKIYPGCAYIDTAVDATLRIMKSFEEKHGRPLRAGEVKSVHVKASLLTIGMEALSAMYSDRSALSPITVNFSVGLSLALLLLDGALRPEALSRENLAARKAEILSLADRVSLEHDVDLSHAMGGLESIGIDLRKFLWVGLEKLDVGGAAASLDPSLAAVLLSAPEESRRSSRDRSGDEDADAPTLDGVSFEKFRMAFPAEVKLVTEGDEYYTERQDVPLGGAGRPHEETSALVRKKFVESASPVLGEKPALRALEQIDHFEEIDSIATFVRSLCRRRKR